MPQSKLPFVLKNFPYLLNRKLINVLYGSKLRKSLTFIQRQTNTIKTVYDIGARHGEWSHEMQGVMPRAKFILFEANDKCEAKLNATGFKYFIGALASESGTAEFYENNSSGDSLYKEATVHFEGVQAKIVQTQTLDGVITQHGLPLPDVIKLDTQGAELDILRGGSEALTHASIVYMECPIIEYNLGAPNIHDYLSVMKTNGFVPFDVCEVHRSANVLMQIDLLFVRAKVLAAISPEAIAKFRLQ